MLNIAGNEDVRKCWDPLFTGSYHLVPALCVGGESFPEFPSGFFPGCNDWTATSVHRA